MRNNGRLHPDSPTAALFANVGPPLRDRGSIELRICQRGMHVGNASHQLPADCTSFHPSHCCNFGISETAFLNPSLSVVS